MVMSSEVVPDAMGRVGKKEAGETVALGSPGVIASHTDVAHLCRGSPTQPPCVGLGRAAGRTPVGRRATPLLRGAVRR